MFGIGMQELVIVLLIALIILGPKKLPEIARALGKGFAEFKRATDDFQENLKVDIEEEPDNSEGVYWFLFFKCDESKLSVSKDDFARAVAAEGLPVNNSYMHVPMRMEWAERFHAFGQNSKLPWSLGRKQSVNLSNVDKVDSMFFNCGLHEDWTQKEVDDLITALKKVESAYLEPRFAQAEFE